MVDCYDCGILLNGYEHPKILHERYEMRHAFAFGMYGLSLRHPNVFCASCVRP